MQQAERALWIAKEIVRYPKSGAQAGIGGWFGQNHYLNVEFRL